MEQTTKRILLLLLKFVVSAALLFVVLKKAGIEKVIQNLRGVNAWYFFLSAVLYVVMAVLVAVRWRMLLHGRYRVGRLFSLQMIGSFFNLILPSSTGGDAIKIYYLYRDTKMGGLSFGSVFLDRFLGLFARLSLGLLSSLVAHAELRTIGMQWAVPGLFVVFTGGALLFFRIRIGSRFGAVADFYDYLHTCLRDRRIMLSAFLLSIIIQALLIASIAATAQGIGRTLSFTELFVFVPVILTVMIIPFSLSGFGVREGAFVLLFSLTGTPASVSVSLSFLWFLSMAAASLIGLVEYVRYRGEFSGPGQSSDQ